MQRPGCSVWGESSLNGACHSSKTFQEAQEICGLSDGRLCTRTELESACTQSTGCSFDEQLIWSSTDSTADPVPIPPTQSPTNTVGFTAGPTSRATTGATTSPVGGPPDSSMWVVCGKGAGRCNEKDTLANPSELHEVRCCSDTEKSGWLQRPGCSVWGESSLNGACHSSKTFQEAQEICGLSDGRLCTRTELESACTQSTGCSFDEQLIWSSTPGPSPEASTGATTTGLNITEDNTESNSTLGSLAQIYGSSDSTPLTREDITVAPDTVDEAGVGDARDAGAANASSSATTETVLFNVGLVFSAVMMILQVVA